MKKNFKIFDAKFLKNKQIEEVSDLIVTENHESIISYLSKRTLKKILYHFKKSNNNFFFVLKIKSKIKGYILIQKPKNKIFDNIDILDLVIDLFLTFNLKVYFNLIIKTLDLDKLFFNEKQKEIYYNSYNISYLAIAKDYQSKNWGRKMINFALKKIKTDNRKSYISVETFNPRASKFYLNKCNFKFLNKKLQLFKLVNVFYKKINF